MDRLYLKILRKYLVLKLLTEKLLIRKRLVRDALNFQEEAVIKSNRLYKKEKELLIQTKSMEKINAIVASCSLDDVSKVELINKYQNQLNQIFLGGKK